MPRQKARRRAERLGGRFAKLWAASTTSALGSGLATVAVPLVVASRTGSPLIVAATFGAAEAPWLLFSLPGGVLMERPGRLSARSAPWARARWRSGP
jgi:hypothetical protein